SQQLPPAITSQPTATPNPTEVGQTVAFAVAASDPDGGALTYTWTFNDGTNGNGAATTHTFSTPGNFTVHVTVADSAGLADGSTVNVVVNMPSGDGSGGSGGGGGGGLA